METQAKQQKMHYHMCSGTVIFTNVKTPEVVDSSTLNAVIVTETQKINTQGLANLQRQLQMQLHNRAGDDVALNVLDVVILNISPLGHMTSDEFLQVGEFAPKPVEGMPTTVGELVAALSEPNQ